MLCEGEESVSESPRCPEETGSRSLLAFQKVASESLKEIEEKVFENWMQGTLELWQEV